MDLLNEIEKKTNSTIEKKAGMAAMAGGAAVSALGATVAFSGFAFYTTMSATMATVAGWFGATLSFGTYTTASSTVAFLAGPVGWTIAAVGLGGGAVMAGWPDSQKTINFVVAAHLIKATWAEADGLTIPDFGSHQENAPLP